MSKSVASSVLLAGAILLAILLPGCSDEPTPSPVAKILPSSTATTTSVPTATAAATLTPTPTQTATPIATPSPIPTATATPTATPTPVPTVAPTPTPKPTPVDAQLTFEFAAGVSEETRAALTLEAERVVSYFAERFGLFVPNITIAVVDETVPFGCGVRYV